MSANTRAFLLLLVLLIDMVGAVYAFMVGKYFGGALFVVAAVCFLMAAFGGRKGGRP